MDFITIVDAGCWLGDRFGASEVIVGDLLLLPPRGSIKGSEGNHRGLLPPRGSTKGGKGGRRREVILATAANVRDRKLGIGSGEGTPVCVCVCVCACVCVCVCVCVCGVWCAWCVCAWNPRVTYTTYMHVFLGASNY